MEIMSKIREADKAEAMFLPMKRSNSLRDALKRFRKETGKSIKETTHKGACYVLFLDRIINGESK